MTKSKKAIAAFITDTHLFEKRSKEDSLIDDNIELNKSLYRQSIKIVKELGLKSINHGGDIFHSRKAQTENLLNVWKDILQIFSDEDICLRAIAGNHDKTNYLSVKSFLTPYITYSHFDLVELSKSIELTSDINLHFIPYFDEPVYTDIYKQHLENAQFNKKNILLTHKTFKGSLLNAGKVSEHGYDVEDVKEFDLVLVGHLHNKHSLGKVQYIGASHQHNFGEDDRKGLTILYDDLSIEQIQLDFPKYLKYEVNPSTITPKDLEDLKKDKDEGGNKIKVVLKGTDAQVKSFDKKLLEDIGIKVETDMQVVQKEIIDEEVKPYNETTIVEQFEKFCNESKHDFKEGLEYLGKVFKIEQ